MNKSNSSKDCIIPNKIEEIKSNNKIVLEQMKIDCPEAVFWLQQISRYGGNMIDGMVLKSNKTPNKMEKSFKVDFFTNNHIYHISILAPYTKEDGCSYHGYLGCTVSAKRFISGEDWTRGNDLQDGCYSINTWNSIKSDIIAYELIRLGKY